MIVRLPRAQQILQKEGFIVWLCADPLNRWTEVTEMAEDGIVPKGTKMLISEEITPQQANAWARRNNMRPIPLPTKFHCYKAVELSFLTRRVQ
jgi:hypothetical protein